jgi:hypothetical protein
MKTLDVLPFRTNRTQTSLFVNIVSSCLRMSSSFSGQIELVYKDGASQFQCLTSEKANKYKISSNNMNPQAVLIIGASGRTGVISSNSYPPRLVLVVLGQTECNGVNVFVVFRTLVVGGSHVKVGFRIGKIVELHLRLVFKDHDGQEAAFLTCVKSRIALRPISIPKLHADVGQEAAFFVVCEG